ncbi:MAG: hypothetical protein RIR86_1054, partial [Acidobacteriota bacterium]
MSTSGQIRTGIVTPVTPLVAEREGTLVEPPNATDVSRYNPHERLVGHGWRGWWRAWQIISTFAFYYVFVIVYHRGWFTGRKDESEERHLRWQAEWFVRQLLKLGPTFIKIGQALATRADLLPLAYIKELTGLQDNVPAFPNPVAFA